MRVSQCVGCKEFPCRDVRPESYLVPDVDLEPSKIRVAMVSEAAPHDAGDHYYAAGEPLFGRTTIQAFRDAGDDASSVRDLLERGIYLTTAVKCGKMAYAIGKETVKRCSELLDRELALFPRLAVILLMGDVAIAAVNQIARSAKEDRVIPSGATYKIRKGRYTWRGRRVFPSYLQAGPAFFIEKSKRRMIADDIGAALKAAGRA